MTCDDVQYLLESITLPQVQAGQHQALLRHLQHCAACQQHWQQWRPQEEQLMLGLATHSAPVTLLEDIMQQIQRGAPLEDWHILSGACRLECSAQGVQRLWLAPLTAVEPASAPASALLSQARQQLEEYLRGERVIFQLSVDLQRCTLFERQVLAVTATIPYGEVRSYKWLAERLGRPGASRAVGNALHRNPVPIFIPCHRIVKSDGSAGGYAFGPDWKQRLLTLERHTNPFVGCSSTRILCYRGCRHERRVQEGNRLHFASLTTALELGYRACKICQPALQEA